MKMENRLKGLDGIKVKVIQKTGGECKTPVAAASIIAKYFFEQAVRGLNSNYKIRFKEYDSRRYKSRNIAYVAKTHLRMLKILLGKRCCINVEGG